MTNDWTCGERIVSGDELLPYKSPAGAVCWRCGAKATTREHKFKRTDLERMWGAGDQYLVHYGGGKMPLSKVTSARKSQQIRFSPNLCAQCNNARSQPFDRAYDRFAEYVWANLDSLRRRRYLDASDIYGNDWRIGFHDLARYVVKHVGCRIADSDFAVPQDFRDFLDGGDRAAHMHMVTFKDRDLSRWRTRASRQGIDAAGLHIDPGMAVINRSTHAMTMYSSSLGLGYVGVMYRWEEDASNTDPFYIYKLAPLHWRHRLPGV